MTPLDLPADFGRIVVPPDPLAEFGQPVTAEWVSRRGDAEQWVYRSATPAELTEALRIGRLPSTALEPVSVEESVWQDLGMDWRRLSRAQQEAAVAQAAPWWQQGAVHLTVDPGPADVALALLPTPTADVRHLGAGYLLARDPAGLILRAFRVHDQWYAPTRTSAPGTSGQRNPWIAEAQNWVQTHAADETRPMLAGFELRGSPEAMVYDVTRPHPVLGLPPLRVALNRINIFASRQPLSAERERDYQAAKELLQRLYADPQHLAANRQTLRFRIPEDQLRNIQQAQQAREAHVGSRPAVSGWVPAGQTGQGSVGCDSGAASSAAQELAPQLIGLTLEEAHRFAADAGVTLQDVSLDDVMCHSTNMIKVKTRGGMIEQAWAKEASTAGVRRAGVRRVGAPNPKPYVVEGDDALVTVKPNEGSMFTYASGVLFPPDEVLRHLADNLADNRMATAVLVQQAQRPAVITWVLVDADRRGQRIGPQLMQWLETELQDRGVDLVLLEAVAEKGYQPQLEAWYRQQGYRNVPGWTKRDSWCQLMFKWLT